MGNPYSRQGSTDAHRKQEPPHGKILGYYVIIYDRNIRGKIIIPASKFDIMKGTVRLP